MESETPSPTGDFLDGPIAPKAPPGYSRNLDNPSNENALALGIVGTCIIVSTVLSILRVYSRVLVARNVRLEDYIGVIGFIFYIAGTCVLATATSGAGLFVHFWDMRMRDWSHFAYRYVVTSILWCLSFLFLKGAILLEWTHIFIRRSTRNAFFWICYGLLTANACLYISFVIAFNFMCKPRERVWEPWREGSCLNENSVNLSFTSLILAFDFLLLVLPHGVIWKLSMSTRQKLGVSFIFSVVLILCACAAGRIAASVQLHLYQDLSYAYSQHLLWGVGEGTSTILVFCAPAIPIIFNRGRRSSRLKMSSSWSMGQRKKSLSDHSQRPWPRINHSSSKAVEDYHRMHEDSATHLQTYGQSQSGSGSMERQEEEHPLHGYLGILKTTEIEITTQAETDLPIINHIDEELRQPWAEIRTQP